MNSGEEHPIMRVIVILSFFLGLVASIITLANHFGHFLTLEWLNQFWLDSQPYIDALREWWKVNSLWSAIIGFAIVAIASWFAEEEYSISDEFVMYLFFLIVLSPIPTFWFILFYTQTSITWLIVLAIGYLTMPLLTISLINFFIERRLERNAIIGNIKKIQKLDTTHNYFETIEYELSIDTGKDTITCIVTYSPYGKVKKPPEVGTKVRIKGNWSKGVLVAYDINTILKK